ncbi:MAG: hypothetical protein ACOX52_01210 [Verrucomicrobiota bacterium]
MGRTRAEAQRRTGIEKRPSCFRNRFVQPETVNLKNSPKGRDQRIGPTHPHGQVENATATSAPSAGGSPDGKAATFSDDLE